MPKDMLGAIVRGLVPLSLETHGVVIDLITRLSDPEWLAATKRFLRKEEAWPDEAERRLQLYSDEEVISSCEYTHYAKPDSIDTQLIILRRYFAHKTCDELLSRTSLPIGAEGWFAIPRWQLVASTYNEAVHYVLGILDATLRGAFVNRRKGRIGPSQLRESKKKMTAFQILSERQGGNDILVVPAQFGARHQGQSARRADAVMTPLECSLGAFEVAVMLLTHPKRLMALDPWVDCTGDEYSFRGKFRPLFHFGGGKLQFDMKAEQEPSEKSGTASVFIT
jgi:hypothetical protein